MFASLAVFLGYLYWVPPHNFQVSGSCECDLMWKKGFADRIKLKWEGRQLDRGSLGPPTGVLMRRGTFVHRRTETRRMAHGGGDRLEMCIDKPRSAGDSWQPAKVASRQDSFLKAAQGAWPCPHCDFGLPASSPETGYISVVVSC